MDSRRKKRFEFFCPLCCSLQKTRTIDKISWQHHLGMAVVTILITLFAWPLFGAKGLSIHLVIWGGFEIMYRLRKRTEFICRNCGFDPFLYKSDVDKMRSEVKSFLQNRILTEGHFRGKKLKNYQTEATPSAPANANTISEAENEGMDKTIIPMPPSTPVEMRAEVVRDEIGGSGTRRRETPRSAARP